MMGLTEEQVVDMVDYILENAGHIWYTRGSYEEGIYYDKMHSCYGEAEHDILDIMTICGSIHITCGPSYYIDSLKRKVVDVNNIVFSYRHALSPGRRPFRCHGEWEKILVREYLRIKKTIELKSDWGKYVKKSYEDNEIKIVYHDGELDVYRVYYERNFLKKTRKEKTVLATEHWFFREGDWLNKVERIIDENKWYRQPSG